MASKKIRGMPPGQPAREEHQQRGVLLQAVCEAVLDVGPISDHLPLSRAELNHEATCDCRRDWKYSLVVVKGQEQILGTESSLGHTVPIHITSLDHSKRKPRTWEHVSRGRVAGQGGRQAVPAAGTVPLRVPSRHHWSAGSI